MKNKKKKIQNLIFPQYGKNIVNFLKKIIKIKKKEKRYKLSKYIIELMKHFNKKKKENFLNYEKRLWLQLFLMSNFKLKIKLPFKVKKIKKKFLKNKKLKEDIKKGKNVLNIEKKNKKIKEYKYYGKNIIKIIKKIKKKDKTEIKNIAKFMKKNYIKWNKNKISYKIIFKDIFNISKGKIDYIKNYKKIIK
ncbi:MAG: DUF4290 domain-containing protein [Candidatus Shikimatogenerans sp. JK-2022]|nr:DUF4290 domain-containing protein [Candidatus Shikimatogenerans bostrichidophilus]